MVMGFALCASVAFAQTNRISHEKVNANRQKAPEAKMAPVDYKASIFGKANGHDTLYVAHFNNASDYTLGVVASSDRINDTLVGGTNSHTVAGDANKWIRYSSISDFQSRVATAQPNLGAMWSGSAASYIAGDMDPENSPLDPADDGFMCLSYNETSSGVFNAYFTLPPVARSADAKMIEVSITQSYIKYYDQCFIDYKKNGQWYAREINVTGIDCEVNSWGATKARYVMPHDLNTESNVELRIRAYAFLDNVRTAYGYWWAIDNVAVMALTLDQYWALNSRTDIDGFYGMLPQGMTIPMTWGVNAQNLSITDITNTRATVYAGTDRDDLAQVIQGPATTVAQGDIFTSYPLLINERGFFVEGYDVASGHQSWPYDGTNTSYGQDHLNAGQQGRGLPATTTGKNFYTINVAGGNLSRTYDTVLYYVTENMTFGAGSTREGGYRWGHDNGVIPAGSSFQVAFTDGGLVTDQGSNPQYGGHVNDAGYAAHVRFITGNDIPEGWVFRGLELITATDRNASDMISSVISPITYVDYYDAETGNLYFENLPCGIDGQLFEVAANDINDQLYTDGGYILPNQGYKAINITFADQPALEPNTSYRFGYRLADDAQFALAATQNTFKFINDTGAAVNVPFRYGTGVNDTIAQYANAAAGVNDYRYNYYPGTYLEVYVYDPVQNKSITAWNIDNYPMIRPIVGPARPVQTAVMSADCSDNVTGQGDNVDHGVSVTCRAGDLCEEEIEVTVGSQQLIVFEPMGDHSIIDRVLLNGVELPVYDDETGEGILQIDDASVYEDPENPTPQELLLQRNAYYMYKNDFQADQEYVFTVFSHWAPFTGIDPVAGAVKLGVSPNPATSSVKVNLDGVEGMVNCSILDMSGRVVYNANFNAESEHMVNVSNFPAGAYFVRVTNNTFSKIEKLIIK